MNTKKPAFKILPFIINLLIPLGIGGVAAIFTTPQIKTWYVYLNKPSFNPPNWIFGPVWTMLYIMIGIAACLIWQHRDEGKNYINARRIYIFQLLFNFSWSIVFFGLHQIFGALIIIVLLLISIIINIKSFSRISVAAAWLLVPYFLWVSFASTLNLFIYLLN
jgi:benzodiazapine receptor